MKTQEQGLVARLTSQLISRGVDNAQSEAIKILKERGHLDSSGCLTEEGLKRQAMGSEGRAKARAEKASGGAHSAKDYRYDPKLNRCVLK